MTLTPDALLQVEDLRTHFFTNEGVVKAVDGVSFSLSRGKTLCVVGESGCGKSITARSILRVVESPGRIVGGAIRFQPEPGASTVDLLQLDAQTMRAIRGKDIAMIFQEPMSALSPLYTIGNQIEEVLRWHDTLSPRARRARAMEALATVGIPRPRDLIDAYTFELSGGMRQRAMIAMALVGEPKLLIADEPTTALDVTTQAVILDLMRGLQEKLGMSIMFITHDLGVVAEIADEVAVMYLGTIVERGSVEAVFADPKHPYTRALLRSIPKFSTRRSARLDVIRGMVPHPLKRPAGCAFHTRCDFAAAGVCNTVVPPPVALHDGREVRCLIYSPEYAVPTGEITAFNPEVSANSIATVTEGASRLNGKRALPLPRPDGTQERRVMLDVKGLKKHFPITSGFFNRVVGYVKAVDGVSFDIYEGETLGLVGESGCGKTTLGHTIMRLYAPTEGNILYRDERDQTIDLARVAPRNLKSLYRQLRMIFQDPYASLNPRLPVLEIVGETLKVNRLIPGQEVESRVRELLVKVGLRPEYIRRYPHAFSGGERQRISIARALAPSPRLVVADEPVSALDVSVRAQILNLLRDLQTEFGLTYLFISHDLSVVAHISDRVAVMYVGKIVELASTEQIFTAPQHPYTEALLSAVLKPDPQQRTSNNRIRLEGEVADPANPPSGCAFHPRCRYAQDRCKHEVPPLRETQAGGLAACHFADELELRGIYATDAEPEKAQM